MNLLPGSAHARGADVPLPNATGRPNSGEWPLSLGLEAIVRRNYNHLERLADAEGLPYFDVSCTKQVNPAHEWPGSGDGTARQLQAAFIRRLITGRYCAHEDRWRARLDSRTGFHRRARIRYWQPEDYLLCLGGRAPLRYALATPYATDRDTTMVAMVDRMAAEATSGDSLGHGRLSGFRIKGGPTHGRLVGHETVLALAQRLVTHLLGTNPMCGNVAQRPADAHMHDHLSTLLGAADYALDVGGGELLAYIGELFGAACPRGPHFGFFPEVADIACETCALMEVVDLCVPPVCRGLPQHWADLERLARNHVVESPSTDGSRLRGYPTHILACHGTLTWGGPELRCRVRALPESCTGSGIHVFYIARKHAASFADGCVRLALDFDKLLLQAEICSHQAHHGFFAVRQRKPCGLKVRPSEAVQKAQVLIAVRGTPSQGKNARGHLQPGGLRAGDQVSLEHPFPLVEEEIAIGNPGLRAYSHRGHGKLATVLSMGPRGSDLAPGYSELVHQEAPIFCGRQRACPLYERFFLLPKTWARPALLYRDDLPVDHWQLRGNQGRSRFVSASVFALLRCRRKVAY